MADTGFITSGTQANDGTPAIAWTNLGNVNASDNAYTSAALGASQSTQGLLLTNFGAGIPANSLITGVEVAIERSATVASRITDLLIQLIKGGTPSGDDKSLGIFWPATDATRIYGSASDLWSLSLSAADVNASTFGVIIRANCSALGGATARLDRVGIRITYFPPVTGTLAATLNPVTANFAGSVTAPATGGAGNIYRIIYRCRRGRN